MGMDWDKVELDARLAVADQRLADLQRTAEWLRDLLEAAERTHAAHRDELARLDGQLVALRRGSGRSATEDQRTHYEALEGQHQRAQDQYREWVWSPAALVEERERAGLSRKHWSSRWPDDIRTRLHATVDALQLACVDRDRVLDELMVLAEQPPTRQPG